MLHPTADCLCRFFLRFGCRILPLPRPRPRPFCQLAPRSYQSRVIQLYCFSSKYGARGARSVEWVQPPSFSYGFGVSDPASAGFLYSWVSDPSTAAPPGHALPRSPASTPSAPLRLPQPRLGSRSAPPGSSALIVLVPPLADGTCPRRSQISPAEMRTPASPRALSLGGH